LSLFHSINKSNLEIVINFNTWFLKWFDVSI
jgi:hypothetical protein